VDAELKRKWVEALRSGGYKQGKGWLRTADDCFCCIGVLCDISGKGEWTDAEPNKAYITPEWYGSALPDPKLLPKTYADKLIFLNDGEGKSFAEIADWIEENVSESGATPAPA
jgi:hypothetical protein